MPDQEKEPIKNNLRSGEFGDTESTVDANVKSVKQTEPSRQEQEPAVKWIQD